MADFIKMPTLGFDMEEGTMGVWRKQIGESVNVGDVLAEIESDKVTQELTARSAGILLVQLAKQGDLIPVGSNLGIIGVAGEDVSAMNGGKPAAKAASAELEPVAAPVSVVATPEPAVVIPQQGPVKATPVARRIAADKHIDLSHVSGSGPGGRIRKADVESFTEKPVTTVVVAPSVAPVVAPTTAVVTESSTHLPLKSQRKAIARRMVESTTTIPQFYVTIAIDMTDALLLRKQINTVLPDNEKVSVNDMVVKACGLNLRQYPNLNSSWGGDTLILHNHIHVGTAVAVEGGLLVVVQKNTDSSPLRQVAADNRAMIKRAREGKVKPDDIQGGTFSTSNLGAYDADTFIAIVNPPEAAILAIGAAIPTPVVKNGEVVVRDMMKVTISADHRITDGAEAAQFMQALKAILEQPMKLLV